MVSSDPLAAISSRNVTHLIHLVEKFSKNLFLLDPVKAVEAAQLKSLTGTLLKKYGPHSGAGVQSDTPKPKAAGRSSGPPLSSLRRKPVTQEMKQQIKGGAALRRSRSGHYRWWLLTFLFVTRLPCGDLLESFCKQIGSVSDPVGFLFLFFLYFLLTKE